MLQISFLACLSTWEAKHSGSCRAVFLLEEDVDRMQALGFSLLAAFYVVLIVLSSGFCF